MAYDGNVDVGAWLVFPVEETTQNHTSIVLTAAFSFLVA